jgi:signal transduction histidine kinase
MTEMAKSRRPKRRKMGLVWRIYFHGLLLLVLVAVSTVLVFFWLGPAERLHAMPERLAAVLQRRIDHTMSTGDARGLKELLDDAAVVFERDIAIFTREGNLVSWGGARTPEPLDQQRLDRLHRRHHWNQAGHPTFGVWLDDGLAEPRHYLVARMVKSESLPRFYAVLGVILLLLALTSYPLARSITRPIGRLTRTARQLAAGDLSARSEVRGGREVSVLAETIDEMAEALQKRIQREKELLANVSHELRTPMSRIRVALELCEEPDENVETLQKRLRGVSDDLGELESLVENVLAITRMESNGTDGAELMKLSEQRLDLGRLVEQSLERAVPFDHRRRVEIEQPDQPIMVRGDPTLLGRVVVNLVQNALQYSDTSTTVEVRLVCRDEDVELQVLDQGIGLQQEDIPRLFEPFYRGEKSRTRRAGGVGLGLALCKKIVDAHRGTITATSRNEGGAQFAIRLPKAPSDAPSKRTLG